MCGISGLINCGDNDALNRMTSILAHRGPDDSGVWQRNFPNGDYVGLGSRRLAILDLSPDGRMPMCNAQGTVWITYNGEVYNYRQLRDELKNKGHQFRSETDTEVVLRLYEEEGPDCVLRLNGMFAFAICDFRSSKPVVFLARDHFGIKPFYYAEVDGGLAFASEVKSLLQVPELVAEIDPSSLNQYLTFLWVPEPQTMFRGICKLPAGHSAFYRNGGLEIKQYWDLDFPPQEHQFEGSEAGLAEQVRDQFQRSVRQQMVSDVPLGAFLSAGLDSSAIVATMASAVAGSGRPLRTYTITYPRKYRVGEHTLDDPAVAARLAKNLGCEHTEIVVEPDVTSLLPTLAWHMDEPVADPAVIAAYLVCREASRESTVMLSGVGGDELFAGYRKHVADRWSHAYSQLPGPIRHAILGAVAAMPTMRGTPLKGTLRLIRKMLRSESLSAVDRFVMNCTYLNREEREQLYSGEWADIAAVNDPTLKHQATFARVGDADFLNQMLYVDSKIFMPSLNLNYNDKMSMASSVEVRVPFLDRELAEFVAWNIPPHMKLKGFLQPATKYIFRKAMKGILPPEVLRQPKAGFAAPVDYWLAHDLKEMVDDLLYESTIAKRGMFNPATIRSMVAEHRSGRRDWSMQIWQFLTLEIWMQTFIDDRARSAGSAEPCRQVATA